MSDSKLRDLSTDFAVKVIKLCETIKGHYSLVNQLERSATSIGANIREANYAHGKPDFISKLQISLKECYETEYWLELFVKADILDRDTAAALYQQCNTIRRLLIASMYQKKGGFSALIIIWDIFHNLPNFAVKDSAKHVYGMCAYTFISFQSCNLPGTDSILFDKCILRNTLFLHNDPKVFV